MKAIAVYPGKPQSVHIEEIPVPDLNQKYDGRGVLVKVLSVGLCGADREIVAGKYGTAPVDDQFLVLGHENIGVVEAVGPNVDEFRPGDHVVAVVRRPGLSRYDLLGAPDMTTDEAYYEHGISRLHGFLCEFYTDVPEFLVGLPASLKDVGVLVEPISIIEKGLDEVYHIQQRLPLWRPKHVAILGAASVGLLATLLLRLRGLSVTTLAMPGTAMLNRNLIEELGAHLISAENITLTEASREYGPFDLILEATGDFSMAFDAMQALAKNGVLLLCSVSGEGREITVPENLINHGFVFGNKVMLGTVTANRKHVGQGVRDLALAELQYPGWLSRLITHRFHGFDDFHAAFDTGGGQDIKRVVDLV